MSSSGTSLSYLGYYILAFLSTLCLASKVSKLPSHIPHQVALAPSIINLEVPDIYSDGAASVPATTTRWFRASSSDACRRNPLSFSVKNYAALGDSYAAGIEAGDPLQKGFCSTYQDSHPAQLNRSDRIGNDNQFQFVACSGAIMKRPSIHTSSGGGTKYVRTIFDQIKVVSKPDFATVSIGGNDAGFFEILDACIYRFYGPGSGTCDRALDRAREIINGTFFTNTYNALMDTLLSTNDDSSFRVHATGYSAFFDAQLSDDCNEESLGYWPFSQPKLTIDLRKSVNEVVEQLNGRIDQIIRDRDDERVVFVNWSHRFDQHRFCQPGKPPEDGENTWFFDAAFRSAKVTGIDVSTCEEHSKFTGDWGDRAACGIAIVTAQHPDIKSRVKNVEVQGGRDAFGTGTARVFHPKSQGHTAIMEEILHCMGPQ